MISPVSPVCSQLSAEDCLCFCVLASWRKHFLLTCFLLHALPILLCHTAPAGLVFFFPVYPGLINQEVMRIKQEAKHRRFIWIQLIIQDWDNKCVFGVRP